MTESVSVDVGIYGPYPPPWGGMGVHLKRLLPLLDSVGVSWQFYNGLGSFSDPPRIINVARQPRRHALASLCRRKHKVCYVITTRTLVRFWGGLMNVRGNRVIIRVGGGSLRRSLQSPRALDRWMARFSTQRVWGVVGVNEEIVRVAAEVRGSCQHVWHVPGFLRPTAEAEEPIEASVQRFLEQHSPVLLAMGSIRAWPGSRSDLYGVMNLVELLAAVRECYRSAGLLMAVTQPQDLESSLGKSVISRICQLGLQDHFHWRVGAGPLVPLMPHCDLLVRPTVDDGDANSLREAVWMNLPAVASDCVPRPEGIVLHRTDDRADLIEKTLEALGELGELRRRVAAAPRQDNWDRLRAVFAEALERPLVDA